MTCPQVRVGALAIGGFLVALYVATTQQSLKGVSMEYFIIIMIAIIAMFVWLERDAF